MDLLILLAEAEAVGLSLSTDGQKLFIRGPKEAKPLADRLGANKLEVIAELRRRNGDGSLTGDTGDTSPKTPAKTPLVSPSPVSPPVGAPSIGVTWHPRLLLTGHDWDSPCGYSPGRPVVRNGVRHKREACASRQSWRHVWGERYCSDCWPCTDPLAMANG